MVYPLGKFGIPCGRCSNGTILTLFISILSIFVGSKDCFLLDCGLEEPFCTLKVTLVGDGASVLAGLTSLRTASGTTCGESVPPPQWQVCLLGIAAVTLPQPHDWSRGCGQALSGLPG